MTWGGENERHGENCNMQMSLDRDKMLQVRRVRQDAALEYGRDWRIPSHPGLVAWW